MNPSAELSALLEASASRKVLPFLGAGFSKNVSSDLPTWHQLTENAARLLGFDGPILEAQADQYQIAEYLELRNELGRFYSDLNRDPYASRFRSRLAVRCRLAVIAGPPTHHQVEPGLRLQPVSDPREVVW
jgi:hypothetical protein